MKKRVTRVVKPVRRATSPASDSGGLGLVIPHVVLFFLFIVHLKALRAYIKK